MNASDCLCDMKCFVDIDQGVPFSLTAAHHIHPHPTVPPHTTWTLCMAFEAHVAPTPTSRRDDIVHSIHSTGQSPHSTRRDEWHKVWNWRQCIKSPNVAPHRLTFGSQNCIMATPLLGKLLWSCTNICQMFQFVLLRPWAKIGTKDTTSAPLSPKFGPKTSSHRA